MTALQVVLLVVGILGVQAVMWTVVLVWAWRKIGRVTSQIRDDAARNGETLLRGPERANYQGGTGNYPAVRGNGVMALTDRRLIFRRLIGAPIEIPSDIIASAREQKGFGQSRMVGRTFLVVELRSGDEVGFLVKDLRAWIGLLQR